MKRSLPSGFMIFAGVLGIATALQSDQDVTKNRKKFDLRELILRKFLRDRHCLDQEFAEVFIGQAGAHGLALVESGGGRALKGNNLFGWANGKQTFATIGEAIHTVASTLAHGRAHRGNDIGGKLAVFNQGTDYAAIVLQIMSQVSPRPQVSAAD